MFWNFFIVSILATHSLFARPFAIAMTIGPFKWQGKKQKKKINCVKYFAKILNNTNKMHKLPSLG
jgi:hypothetical protein